MGKRSQVIDWLKNDPAQLAWASNYLIDHKQPHLAHHFTYGYVEGVTALENFARTLLGEKVVRTMRGTWQKSENNRKGGRPTFSYTLPKRTDAALARLAGQLKQSKSATLEQLIHRGFEFEQEERKIRKAALDKEREAWKNKKPLAPFQTMKEQALSRKVAALQNEVAKRQELFNTWLALYVRREVLLGTLPINAPLDTAQQQAVIQRHSELLEYHRAKLAAALGPEGVPDLLPDLSDMPELDNVEPSSGATVVAAGSSSEGDTSEAPANDQGSP